MNTYAIRPGGRVSMVTFDDTDYLVQLELVAIMLTVGQAYLADDGNTLVVRSERLPQLRKQLAASGWTETHEQR